MVITLLSRPPGSARRELKAATQGRQVEGLTPDGASWFLIARGATQASVDTQTCAAGAHSTYQWTLLRPYVPGKGARFKSWCVHSIRCTAVLAYCTAVRLLARTRWYDLLGRVASHQQQQQHNNRNNNQQTVFNAGNGYAMYLGHNSTHDDPASPRDTLLTSMQPLEAPR